jgi:tRNA nucleotidyltransferase/poly(A) polymerase
LNWKKNLQDWKVLESPGINFLNLQVCQHWWFWLKLLNKVSYLRQIRDIFKDFSQFYRSFSHLHQRVDTLLKRWRSLRKKLWKMERRTMVKYKIRLRNMIGKTGFVPWKFFWCCAAAKLSDKLLIPSCCDKPETNCYISPCHRFDGDRLAASCSTKTNTGCS